MAPFHNARGIRVFLFEIAGEPVFPTGFCRVRT
jgi:hypothetical protein